MHPDTRKYLVSCTLECAGVAIIVADLLDVAWWAGLIIGTIGWIGRWRYSGKR